MPTTRESFTTARVDPIPFQVKNDLTGLGKTTQDFRMIETTVAERRKLDSERQRKETEDQRRAREASLIVQTNFLSVLIFFQDDAARKAALKSEITDTLKAFYCALCEKQFQNVAQYDEHTNSYAHHHKARLRDMQANTRMTSQEDLDKRKEKERKREEKELRKIAKAAGIKMAKPATAPAPMTPTLAPAGESSLPSEAQSSSSFKKAGWATVATTVEPATSSRRPGWVSLDSTTSPAPSAPAPPPPAPAPASGPSPVSHSVASATPIFRTGGWTSLDTGSSMSVTPPPNYTAPPPPPPLDVAPPPPPILPMNAPPLGGLPPFPPAYARPPGGPPPLPPTSAPLPPPGGRPPFPPTPGGWGSTAPAFDPRRWDQTAPAPMLSQPRSPPPAPPASGSGSLEAPVPPPATPQARTGWQQWKRGGSSKRR
jgi:hypothetical protein